MGWEFWLNYLVPTLNSEEICFGDFTFMIKSKWVDLLPNCIIYNWLLMVKTIIYINICTLKLYATEKPKFK